MSILKQLREESGMTQNEVATFMGVTRNTVQNWESNYVFRNKDDLHALLDLYKADSAQRALALTLAYGDKRSEPYEFAILANEAIAAYSQIRQALIDAITNLDNVHSELLKRLSDVD